MASAALAAALLAAPGASAALAAGPPGKVAEAVRGAATPAPHPPPSPRDSVAGVIRGWMEAGGVPLRLRIEGDMLYAARAIPTFYERRVFRPAWIGSDGPLRRSRELLEALEGAASHGLPPAAYHVAAIRELLAGASGSGGAARPDAVSLAGLELLLTDAFLVYGSHLLSGRVDAVRQDPAWVATPREGDLVSVLEEAVAGGSVGEALEALAPSQPAYARLRESLARYRELAEAGGWPAVPAGDALRPGDTGARVGALRRRLRVTGDLPSSVPASEPERFDEGLAAAVVAFQRRHGLAPDTVVGRETLGALDVPARDRVRQIEVNLERWRWMPEGLGRRHVLVNLADFHLEAVRDGRTELEMRVIVGQLYRQSPVFSDSIRYLVLNPSWYVPRSIAVRDKLPRIKEDPGYVAAQEMILYRGSGPDAEAVDPRSVDWSRITAENFPFRLVQRPGTKNALGRIKFMFPNRFNVYLHDTPQRELFARQVRTLSSGCIRIEKPLAFAEWVLQDPARWNAATVEEALAAARERVVRLPEPVPVHLQYWTAWSMEGGDVHFRNDIYGRDTRLRQTLESAPVLTSPLTPGAG